MRRWSGVAAMSAPGFPPLDRLVNFGLMIRLRHPAAPSLPAAPLWGPRPPAYPRTSVATGAGHPWPAAPARAPRGGAHHGKCDQLDGPVANLGVRRLTAAAPPRA